MEFGKPFRREKSQIQYKAIYCSEIQPRRGTANKLSCLQYSLLCKIFCEIFCEVFLTENISQNKVSSKVSNFNCSLFFLMLFLSNFSFSNHFSCNCFVEKISAEGRCVFRGRERVIVVLTLY